MHGKVRLFLGAFGLAVLASWFRCAGVPDPAGAGAAAARGGQFRRGGGPGGEAGRAGRGAGDGGRGSLGGRDAGGGQHGPVPAPAGGGTRRGGGGPGPGGAGGDDGNVLPHPGICRFHAAGGVLPDAAGDPGQRAGAQLVVRGVPRAMPARRRRPGGAGPAGGRAAGHRRAPGAVPGAAEDRGMVRGGPGLAEGIVCKGIKLFRKSESGREKPDSVK